MMESRTQKTIRTGLLLSSVLMTLLFSAAPGAWPAGVSGRWVPVKPIRTVVQPGESSTTVHVKFVRGLSPRPADGAFTAAPGTLSGLNGLMKAHAVESVQRLFSQPETDVSAHRLAIEAATGEEVPDLNLWYRITVPVGTDTASFIDGLNSLPEVEIAYPAPLPAPPPAAEQRFIAAESATPDYVSYQLYLNPAPGGIDARYAWTQRGGTGGKVTIVDIEYNFNATHEDLPQIPVIHGQLWDYYGDNHGTAVLGELVAVNNDYGVTGIAYSAAAKFASPCPTAGTCSGYNPADAINAARLNTQKGDVILLEQQVTVCGLSEGKFGPIEWYQDIFEAIKLATADGRIVVEAAGNGNVNLDQQACEGRFNRAVRNSGAIIVGAGAPPNFTQEDRSRLSFSSYGSRVDLQGWGEWVTTTGYKDLYQGSGRNEWYTEVFSGTSSASPIVAGAAALLSSAARDRGTVLTPDRVRTILLNTGCVQQYSLGFPVTERIGPRPNLRAAIGRLPAPAVAAAPAALRFRSVKKGTPLASQRVTVRNRGDRETLLIIEDVAITGSNASEFSVDRGACKEPLGPGKTCTLSVFFSPASSGPKSASLTLSSNDPKKPHVIVSLSGDAATAAER